APYLAEAFGNPSSVHAWGREASSALEEAREGVAALLGAEPDEVYFVRGGTESDNLAILGRADQARRQGRDPIVATSAVEHRAVLDAAAEVADGGGARSTLPVRPDGTLDAEALDEVLDREPAVVSVMWVNNEVGIRLPVPELARRCREAGVPLHTDAVQAVGRVPVRVDETPVDLLTLTGHKIYGPKGTGVLFVREGTELRARLFGGGQERGLRPGTQDVAGAVGVAEALRLAVGERESEAARLAGLRDDVEAGLRGGIPDLRIHGESAPRAPHISNVGVPDADLDGLMVGLDLAGIACSSGSACSSGAHRTSHVLRALYGTEAEGVSPLRFSLGRDTTAAHVERAVAATVRVVERVRQTEAAAR
ncbi:MAG: aminotransferase class V-fold PLP-dependent enzyme, partial [Gemmatimonadetes bacterium]|nr:cysteine desulfurase [Gemmatimonadota bacterium]NIR76876.1 cysteine desulfurase [Gemmatimonadota bacterium]NIT85404.1 cysteine desulfurase [Gemmatimonadota bacterium]NIU29218.1 cysteine desulfurase [Gemmatimonadota bacterium]NIU34311.1 aminotransferase class V-fold PLP-dependent enzyme [Gemmatimonadota bacterium]